MYFQTGEHGYDLQEIHRLGLDGTIERITTLGDGWGLLWVFSRLERGYYKHIVDNTQRVFGHDITTDKRIQLSGPVPLVSIQE
ncbi:hypothetical protein ACFQL7_05595 [Halocatena marina]|uniref:Uncharacterized protein n=1 Tax=Halocatena marina TaxID=2934937 RepID=A0ABD5YLC7_9EURY